MATAGYCNRCGTYVYLDERWSCPTGHGWDAVSGWYDPETRAPITPPWLQQRQPERVTPTQIESELQPDSTPSPAPPPDPAVTLRQMIGDTLRQLNLTVTERDGVYSASRGDEYEAALSVDGTNGRILLWERLASGRDPGVRDAVRALASGGWQLKIVLRKDGVG